MSTTDEQVIEDLTAECKRLTAALEEALTCLESVLPFVVAHPDLKQKAQELLLND